jgi:hypothetical protein
MLVVLFSQVVGMLGLMQSPTALDWAAMVAPPST